MSTLMVIGAAGNLGSHLLELAPAAGWEVIAGVHRAPAPGRSVFLDLTDAASITTALQQARPTAVINAAYAHGSWAITAVGPALVAQACQAVGADLLHVSTDAVFSGQDSPYDQDATPDPLNPYGAAKAAAEVAVAAVMPTASIVRTSLILGPGGAFEEHVLAVAAGERDGLMFTDDIRCAVHVDDLARAALELVGRPGIHHVAGPDAVSRMEIAELICARDGLSTAKLRPGLRADLPTPGPLDLRLESTRTRSALQSRVRGAREFLSHSL